MLAKSFGIRRWQTRLLFSSPIATISTTHSSASFLCARDLLRQMPQQAGDREDLRKLLDRPSGGVIFTTIKKFAPEEGRADCAVLTDRRNVVVIADESHRSQYGFGAKVE